VAPRPMLEAMAEARHWMDEKRAEVEGGDGQA
jgi:hypothetical protein